MKTMTIDAPGAFSFHDVEPPRPGDGEVLLKVSVVGFCGSDLNTFRGLNPMVSYPRVPGHEVGAVVEAVGSGVPDSIHPGLAATLSPYTACGRCPSCRRGRTNCCRDNQTLGVQRDGVFARWFATPWEKLFLFEGLSPRDLALVEPLSVGYHATCRGRVGDGDAVAVLGCGAIGLGAISGAKFRRARRIIAVDIDDAKLAVAGKAGATEVVNSAHADLRQTLRVLTEGDGPDVIIEAVGLPQTFRAAVDEAAFAGRVVYIGYAKAPVEYETKQIVQKELDVMGSRNAMPQDFRDAAATLLHGAFPVTEAVTRSVPLDAAGDALREWSANPAAVTKIHVAFDD